MLTSELWKADLSPMGFNDVISSIRNAIGAAMCFYRHAG